jgi:hypothetical protein
VPDKISPWKSASVALSFASAWHNPQHVSARKYCLDDLTLPGGEIVPLRSAQPLRVKLPNQIPRWRGILSSSVTTGNDILQVSRSNQLNALASLTIAFPSDTNTWQTPREKREFRRKGL